MNNTYVMSLRKADTNNSVILVYNNTYCIKDILKNAGYSFDEESAHWYKIIDRVITSPKDELANIITLTDGLTNIVKSKSTDMECKIVDRIFK